MLRVVAGLWVGDDGRVLMAERTGPDPGWEFPGGKVEAGESDPQALIREWREELGVDVQVSDRLAEVRHPESEPSLHLTLYRIEFMAGPPAAAEAQALGWFDPQALEVVPMPPADVALVERLETKPGILEGTS